MFALPQVLEIPGLTIAGGIMEWPWLGALFAWLLVAALVGSALALLRDYTRGSPVSTPGRPARSDHMPIEHTRLAIQQHRPEAA